MDDERASARSARLSMLLALVGLAVILLGVKVMYVQHFGSAVPFWDQWDAEASLLYRPYMEGRLNWDILLSPHNEHRIFLTRLLSIALFELNGGWNPILQMIVNAFLHIGSILLLVLAIRPILTRAQILPLVCFVGFLFVLPIGWENILAGFQSQFYFLLIFSILALAGFAHAEAFSLRWWLSVLCTIGAFFSMASGALVAAASLAVLLLQVVIGLRRGVREYAGVLLLLGMAIAMVAFVPSIAGHEGLKAQSMSQFVNAFLVCIDYPRKNPLVGIWINLPLVLYACYVLFTLPPRMSPHWIVFSLIVWWFGQMFSLSYGRAALAPNSSRYLDITIVAMPINFGILLFAQANWNIAAQRFLLPAIAIWLAIVTTGLVFNTQSSAIPSALERAAQAGQQEVNVLAYLRTGDISTLRGKPYMEIPYPVPERLASLLSDPLVRLLLPSSIRPADIAPSALLDRTVLKGRFHSAIEGVQSGLMHLAPILIGIGIAFLFLAGLISRRGKPAEIEGRGQPAS